MKCGLELHMQLDTGKLFCRCPNIIQDEKPDYVIKRKLRAVVGETGKLDIAAKEEAEKDRVIKYNCYYDCVCLVDTDEEPPKSVDKNAFKAAMEIALLLNMKPVDEFHVMRKLIIDGSTVSGFQRTGLLARNGYIETSKGKVRIATLMLEEDSAKRVDDNTFSLDRLGIPLVEVATEADIVSGAHAREVAEKLGMLCKFTGKLMRGIGTIRQDVNVSIDEGDRVEIKGVQDLRMMSKFVNLEVERQSNLLKIKQDLTKRKINLGKLINLTKTLSNTKADILKGKSIFGIKLLNAKGILGTTIQLSKRFGKELAEYLKIYVGLKGLLHNDELPNYGITKAEVSKVRKTLSCSTNDSFILIICTKEEANKAINVLSSRLKQAMKGVPREVRAPNHTNGISSFMRPLPGGARMYPETDVPTIRITQKMIENIIKNLSETPEQKYELLISMGLNNELAQQLLHDRGKLVIFDKITDKTNVDNKLTASLILENKVETLKIETLIKIFKALENNKFSKEAVPKIIRELKNNSFEKVIKRFKGISTKELAIIVKKVIKKYKKERNNPYLFGIVMKDLMSTLRGKVDAALISKVVRSEINKKESL